MIVPGPGREAQLRVATRGADDPAHDLALLHLPGPPLPALPIRDSESVREGESILFTGYPIGAVLGPFPATHRGMVSAITPIAIPAAHSSQLKPELIRRLGSGPFPVFQLDATAYPGNSGSPVYDPATGEVIGIVNMVFVKGTKESALDAAERDHLRDSEPLSDRVVEGRRPLVRVTPSARTTSTPWRPCPASAHADGAPAEFSHARSAG